MTISSPDKVLFPDEGFTKLDVVGYYATVAEKMLPHLAERPLTLQRFPSGIGSKGFMQKNAADYFPDSILRYEVPKREGGTTIYPVITEPTDIVYLANLNTITFHIWTARTADPEHPDRLVFDLDPPADAHEAAREGAWAVKALLDDLGVPSVPSTTGSKGYHVTTPIQPNVPAHVLSDAARGVAELLAVRHPDLLTTEFQKKNRKNRVFLDWMRTGIGPTVVAPWSVRARPGAPVSVPTTWDQLNETSPQQWTIMDDVADLPDTLAALDPVDATPLADVIPAMVEDAGIVIEPFDRFRS